jgi:uncharacterized protein YrzB (UPF0473 family)
MERLKEEYIYVRLEMEGKERKYAMLFRIKIKEVEVLVDVKLEGKEENFIKLFRTNKKKLEMKKIARK